MNKLKQMGVTHVLNLAKECAVLEGGGIETLKLGWEDHAECDLEEGVRVAVEFIGMVFLFVFFFPFFSPF